ncbi:hypothetical protein [Streptomyces decoyicus]|uniref:hypothetical protein n=1 Tax=Streptomyces decoyicus TaxID=249567 RepID=UPI003C12B6A5
MAGEQFGALTPADAGESSEKAALIYQHSDLARQQEVASGLDNLVQAARSKTAQKPSGADPVRDACTGPDNEKGPGRRPGPQLWSG